MSRTEVDTGVADRPQAPRPAARRPARPRPPLSREVVETRILGVLKWITIAFFVIATLFPFYYMVELSVRTIEDLALDPAALADLAGARAGGRTGLLSGPGGAEPGVAHAVSPFRTK